MKDIVFATGNRHKQTESQEILGSTFHLLIPADLGYDEDIPETHNTLDENSLEKVNFIWNKFHKTCFADDTGLEVDALNGAPGVLSARYAGEPKNPANNITKLLKELQNVPAPQRTARFRCVVSLIENGTLYTFEGICEGHITMDKKGVEGFGYDPVFVPSGMSKTMAELSLDEKNKISHRGKAMKKLLCHLSQNLK